MPPLVTIITSTYNAVATLDQCLASVQLQDYPSVEHIVIDGGSTDGTVQLLRTREGLLASLVSEPDEGVFDAWNKGLALARGEWIAFLGADDKYLPGAISAYMRKAKEQPDAEYLSSRVRWVHENGRARTIGGPWAWPRFQRYMCTAHVGSMHRRSLFERYGLYDNTYGIVGDYELLLRPRDSLRAAFLPAVTVEMKAGGQSDSFRALEECATAKQVTGGRSAGSARLDLIIGQCKLAVRRFLH